ncbi:predicted protein [Botrytis cinerea T4]|uniref:Uncharacterized protein n=1 Tax=Botryotinia fuckeliana (strain T4) TaxID=999810 RepID=G2YBT2_BOTF4|nr:predicted protein [Botrytis cinerea T4]
MGALYLYERKPGYAIRSSVRSWYILSIPIRYPDTVTCAENRSQYQGSPSKFRTIGRRMCCLSSESS